MNTYQLVLARVQADPRYLSNITWGKARSGHPEGTIEAHIRELEGNLERLRPKLKPEQADLLRLLVHVHDTFKAEAESGVAIDDSRSHASLAAAFLCEFLDDEDVLAMVRLHDEPHALWRQVHYRGTVNEQRLERLLASINDWDTFLAFQLIDNVTAGKSGESVAWFIQTTRDRLPHRLSPSDVTPHN